MKIEFPELILGAVVAYILITREKPQPQVEVYTPEPALPVPKKVIIRKRLLPPGFINADPMYPPGERVTSDDIAEIETLEEYKDYVALIDP